MRTEPRDTKFAIACIGSRFDIALRHSLILFYVLDGWMTSYHNGIISGAQEIEFRGRQKAELVWIALLHLTCSHETIDKQHRLHVASHRLADAVDHLHLHMKTKTWQMTQFSCNLSTTLTSNFLQVPTFGDPPFHVWDVCRLHWRSIRQTKQICRYSKSVSL